MALNAQQVSGVVAGHGGIAHADGALVVDQDREAAQNHLALVRRRLLERVDGW